MRLSFTLLLFSPVFSFAQALEQEVISTTGEKINGVAHSIDWTLGELVGDAFSSSSVVLSSGFQQCFYCDCFLSVNENSNQNIGVYPNPFDQYLMIQLNGYGAEVLIELAIYNLPGEVVYAQNIQGKNEYPLSLDFLAPGAYYLKVTASKELVKTIKIIKN